ncbi:GNAT family N-acetyltransferase [Undibacterium sp. Di24W]|uniref:GNAT family N-acetyltransferase n=1 Tax=Undibacterium sp. Di24W TaxID=3413033 RepID=UPI003BF1AF42
MIRSANKDDFDFVYRLYMHPEVNPFLLYELMDEDSFRPIFEELLRDGVLYIFRASDEENASPTGMFKLIQLKHRTSHIAYLGGVAIDSSFTGRGYGVHMMQEIIALAESKGVKRLELSTGVHNLRAAALYEKCGFKREGILRHFTYLKTEDRYIDEVLMSYLF